MPASHANPNQPTDEELILRVNRGDTEAFGQLYDRHKLYCLRVARKFTSTEADAQDVVQETFTWFLGRFPGFELTARLTTYLFPVVRNTALTKKRKGRLEHAAGDALPDTAAEPATAPAGSRASLERVLRSLPEHQREVLLMRFADGLSLSQVAGVLGIPIGTVKSRVHLAIASLRQDPATAHHFGLDPPASDKPPDP